MKTRIDVLWKCRNCGVKFANGFMAQEEEFEALQVMPDGNTTLLKEHTCDKDHTGIADYVGCRHTTIMETDEQ
jgi:hypothetical protein